MYQLLDLSCYIQWVREETEQLHTLLLDIQHGMLHCHIAI